MLKDNQLSTVLLLVALGFLIYYLTKPKLVSNEKEQFANLNQDTLSEIMAEIEPEVKYLKSKAPLTETKVANTMPESYDAVSEIHSEIIKQILDESKQESKQESRQASRQESRPESRQEETPKDPVSLFDFEANDINNSEFGASLDNAFDRPIPHQANPSEVPINKNNLKKYDAKDFLPKELNDSWFDTDFSQAKYNVNDDKLINTDRYIIGVNTVGQSLKNASYDIRGTIANPKFTVSPWNNSTYEPDFNIKPLS